MRLTRLWAVALLAALVCAAAADGPDHVPGRLLVGLAAAPDTAAVERVLAMHRASVRRRIPQLGLSQIDVPEASSQAIAESLRRTGMFAYVEPDYYAHTAAVPNDPSFVSQWYLTKILGPQAWNVTIGSNAVPIAVIDSGVYPHHLDLQAKMLPGWNFVKSSANTSDVVGHGTAVAGTVGSASNNGLGIAGVSWNSPILPLVVVDDSDFAAYSDIAAAVQYAADQGVRVMNISIGGAGQSTALQTAIDYAWSKGAVIIASAMNDSTSARYYPAACNHVVAVSATDSNDHLASFSNYGDWITVAAPGTNILSTMVGGGYGYWNGTSFSSPIVAGIAALCLAVNPALTNAAVVAMLEQTADDLGAPGYDTLFGHGRVNAYRAVSAALQSLPTVTRGQPARLELHAPRPRR